MDLSNIFSRALTDYKKNPKFVVPHLLEWAIDIALIVTAVLLVTLAGLALMPALAAGDILELLYGEISFTFIAILVLGAFLLIFTIALMSAAARAAIIAMAREAHMNGATSLGTGLNGVKRFTLGLFLFSAFAGIVLITLTGLALIPFVLGSVFLGVFASILGAVLYLVFYIFVFFTPQFIVTREGGVLSGIKESVGFVEKNFSSVIIYCAVVIAVTIGVALVTNVPAFAIDLIENQFLNMALSVLNLLFSIGLSLVIAPYFDIVKTYMVMEV